MFPKRYITTLTSKLSTINLPRLAGMYVLAFLCVELLIDNPIRLYNFCVFLSLSGIYFAWLIGGKRTMYYVAFFNIFFVCIFSSLLWNKGIIVYSGLFVAKSFLAMYAFALFLLLLMLFKKSPADKRMELQKLAVEEARQQRQNLEFMVASRKLTQDMLAQANLVKDELQLLEGAWRSKIHDIINDLPPVKERELYRQIITPFQENIIKHLRDLTQSLTYDLEPIALSELSEFLSQKITHTLKMGSYGNGVDVRDNGWRESTQRVIIDKNKVWDMVLNVLRNSQAALDLKRINMLRSSEKIDFQPRICVAFCRASAEGVLKVIDNGGGIPSEQISMLYREPVPSAKRQGKSPGQGTLFVKFFAERMGMSIGVENTTELGNNGLAVSIYMPLQTQ